MAWLHTLFALLPVFSHLIFQSLRAFCFPALILIKSLDGGIDELLELA